MNGVRMNLGGHVNVCGFESGLRVQRCLLENAHFGSYRSKGTQTSSHLQVLKKNNSSPWGANGKLDD